MSDIQVQPNPQPILSSNGIHHLYHTFYDPHHSVPVKATLLIVHGMSEHSGRYDAFARFLATHGIAVATYDQLGHGKTVHTAQELGYFHHSHPAQMVLRDVIKMSQALTARHAPAPPTLDAQKSNVEGIPHCIMGHSMGSFITRNILTHHSHLFNGAILMGTSDKDPLVSMLLPLVNMLSKKAPNKRPQWLTYTTAKVLNAKLSQREQLTAEEKRQFFTFISKNVANRDAYDADPLCGFTFTNNGYATLFELMNLAINKNWYQPLPKDYPLLVISGENDPIGNMGKGINKLVTRLASAGYSKVTKVLYPDLRHEPLNEENPQPVYDDILNWMTAHIA